MSRTRRRFDKAYYDRFYRNPSTRASTPAAAKKLAAFIGAYLRHLELPPRSILDVGCGTGSLLRALGREFPKARCHGLEVSGYLCGRYGWEHGSIANYGGTDFDLVICNDVLPYLDDKACNLALANIARACNTASFIGVLTEEDLPNCDRARTDAQQIVRPAQWYRRRLRRAFRNVGGGLYLKQPVPVTVWALDALD